MFSLINTVVAHREKDGGCEGEGNWNLFKTCASKTYHSVVIPYLICFYRSLSFFRPCCYVIIWMKFSTDGRVLRGRWGRLSLLKRRVTTHRQEIQLSEAKLHVPPISVLPKSRVHWQQEVERAQLFQNRPPLVPQNPNQKLVASSRPWYSSQLGQFFKKMLKILCFHLS